MPAPTAYSDASLASFMVTELGTGTFGDGVAGILGWTPGSDAVAEAAADTAVILGTAVLAATNMATLRAVARLSIWRMAEGALASRYAIATDGQSRHAEQVWDHAKSMVARYEAQCARLGLSTAAGSGIVRSYPMKHAEAPYAAPVLAVGEF